MLRPRIGSIIADDDTFEVYQLNKKLRLLETRLITGIDDSEKIKEKILDRIASTKSQLLIKDQRCG